MLKLQGPFVSILFALLLLPLAVYSQSPESQGISKRIPVLAKLSEDEMDSLRKGEQVIVELPGTVGREVALLGVAKLPYSIKFGWDGLQRATETQTKETAIYYGKFKADPSVKDLTGLKLDSGDVGDLEQCRINDCEWNLSGSIIGSLQKIDWSASDARDRAASLLKQQLTDYVENYMQNGDKALMSYRDTDPPLSLESEYKELDPEISIAAAESAEFGKYVRGYPNYDLKGIINDFDWTLVKVGLKPVFMITHSMTLETANEKGNLVLSVSKQIFANHYFDSSLGVTMLVEDAPEDGRPTTWLIMISRTRTSALSGTFAGFLRGLIKNRAKGKLTAFIADAKKYSTLAAANANSEVQRQALEDAKARSSGRRWFWPALGVVLVAAVLVIFLLLRKRKG